MKIIIGSKRASCVIKNVDIENTSEYNKTTDWLVKILLNREVSTMKSNTQNAKSEIITEKTLVIGIDVGSETHYARAFDYRGIEYSKKPFKFSNTETGFTMFKEWILDLKETHGKDKAVSGIEPTGHYWFHPEKFL